MVVEKITKPSGHFVALCPRYPNLSLTVYPLKKLFAERGLEQEAPLIKFQHGQFDSRQSDLEPEEIAVVKNAIEKCDEFAANLIAIQDL